MQRLTAQELFELVEKNPNWIGENATRENPVEVLGCCIFDGEPIESLSPFITFLGDPFDPQDELGSVRATTDPNTAASFIGCEKLKTAAGTFHGHVDFSESGINKIHPELTVFPTAKFPGYEAKDQPGSCASFRKCYQLKIARGIYHGTVRFSESGIEEISPELRVTRPNERGTAAVFLGCEKLIVARGTYPGQVNFARSGVERIENLEITAADIHGWAANFQECPYLKVLTGTFAGGVKANMCRNLVAIHSLTITAGSVDVEHCRLHSCQPDLLESENISLTPKDRAIIRRNQVARNALKKPLEEPML